MDSLPRKENSSKKSDIYSHDSFYIVDNESNPIMGDKLITFRKIHENPSRIEIFMEDSEGRKWVEVEEEDLIAMMQFLKIKRKYIKKSYFADL